MNWFWIVCIVLAVSSVVINLFAFIAEKVYKNKVQKDFEKNR